MSEALTANGHADHGAPDPQPDPTGLCHRCHKQERHFTEVGGVGYCDSCAEMVSDIHHLFKSDALEGTGAP